MSNPIDDLVSNWARKDSSYLKTRDVIEFLSEKLFYEYEPTKSSKHFEFSKRLFDWISSAKTDAQKKLLFEFVPEILFIGEAQYSALCRTALNGPITWWLMNELALSFNQSMKEPLAKALNETWFCGITDSMPISKFYHLNGLSGKLRPDWKSLFRLNVDIENVKSYMKDTKGRKPILKRIVLLEDFVGSGTQMADAIKFSLKLDVPVLFCPLMICPKGATKARKLEKQNNNLTYTPVMELELNDMIGDQKRKNENHLAVEIRKLISSLKTKINSHPYKEYGFKNTGSLVVMHTNCPNNTLPLIWNKKNTWAPLFPRANRG